MAPLRPLLLKSRKVSEQLGQVRRDGTNKIVVTEVKRGEILERGGVEGIKLAVDPCTGKAERSDLAGTFAGDAKPGAGLTGRRPRGQRVGSNQRGFPSEIRRSASASGLMAMAEHISTKNEWRSSCSAMVKACLRWKVINCSGLHASLPLNLEIATRLIEEEILEEGNNSLFSEKDRTFSLT